MAKDNNEKIEKLKLTTPRRHVKRYASPFQNRKLNGLTLINNGRSSYNRHYKVNKIPVLNGQTRQLVRERQIDHIRHDSSKTLEWMGSLISRAKNVLKTLKEEDMQLREQLYENSRRKELRTMHVQSILDKKTDYYENKSTTASSDVSQIVDVPIEDRNDTEELSNDENIPLSDDALVILTDSEPEEDEIINENYPGSEEMEEHAIGSSEIQLQDENEGNLFGEESEYDSNLSENEVSEYDNSIEKANKLLSSDDSIVYQDREDDEDIQSQDDSVINEQHGSYIQPENVAEVELLQDEEDKEEDISVERSISSDISHEESNRSYDVEDQEGDDIDDGMQYAMPPQEAVSNSAHFLQSDIQKIAHQAIFGNSHTHDHLNYNSDSMNDDISNEEISEGNGSVPHTKENYGNPKMDYGYEDYENISKPDEDKYESEGQVEDEPESAYEGQHGSATPNSNGQYTEDEQEDEDEPIEIEVESELNSDDQDSISGDYRYNNGTNQIGYPLNEALHEASGEVSNDVSDEVPSSGGVQSIADILSSIPKNIIHNYNDQAITHNLNENEINTQDIVDGSINIGDDRIVDNLPIYSDKIYHEVHEEKVERGLREEESNQKNLNTLLHDKFNAGQESNDFSTIDDRVTIGEKVAITDSTIKNAETFDQDENTFYKHTIDNSDIEKNPTIEPIQDKNRVNETSHVQIVTSDSHTSFVNEDTSMYFTVDEGNTSLTNSKLDGFVQNPTTNTQGKYKVEISESVYESSNENQSVLLTRNNLKYTSPFGSDPFSASSDVNDVNSLLKETLRSISGNKDSSQDLMHQIDEIQQARPDTESYHTGNSDDIISEADEMDVSQKENHEIGVVGTGVEHLENNLSVSKAEDNSGELKREVPQHDNVLVSSNSEKEDIVLDRTPDYDMLALLANVAQNHTAENESSEMGMEQKLEVSPQNVSNDNFEDISNDNSNGEHNSSQLHQLSEQAQYDRTNSPHNEANNSEEDISSDADDEMVTALHDMDGNNDIAQFDHNSDVLNDGVPSTNFSPERLGSPAFHILGEAIHANNIIGSQIEYPTPMESAASSDTRNEYVPMYHSNSEELRMTDSVNLSEEHSVAAEQEIELQDVNMNEPIDERESFTSLKFEDDSSSSEDKEDGDVEMLDSSDVEQGEQFHEQKKQNIVQKIFRAPFNTIKYLADNINHITNVTASFVDELNAYPSENDTTVINNEDVYQQTTDADIAGSNSVTSDESMDSDARLLHNDDMVSATNTDILSVSNSDDIDKNGTYGDIEILDDTIDKMPDKLYDLNKQEATNHIEILEKNIHPQLINEETQVQQNEFSDRFDNHSNTVGMELDSNRPSDVKLENPSEITEKEVNVESVTNNNRDVVEPVDMAYKIQLNYINDNNDGNGNDIDIDIDSNDRLNDVTFERKSDDNNISRNISLEVQMNNATNNEVNNEDINNSNSTAESTAHEEFTNTDVRMNPLSDEETAHENTANDGHASNVEGENIEQQFSVNHSVTDDSTANEDNVAEISSDHNLELGANQEAYQEEITTLVTTLPAPYSEEVGVTSNIEQSPGASAVKVSGSLNLSDNDSKYYSTADVDVALDHHSSNEDEKNEIFQNMLEDGRIISTDNFTNNNEQERESNFLIQPAFQEELSQNRHEANDEDVSMERKDDYTEHPLDENILGVPDILPNQLSSAKLDVVPSEDVNDNVELVVEGNPEEPEASTDIDDDQPSTVSLSNSNNVNENDIQVGKIDEQDEQLKESEEIKSAVAEDNLITKREDLSGLLENVENGSFINIGVGANEQDDFEIKNESHVDIHISEEENTSLIVPEEEKEDDEAIELAQESDTGKTKGRKEETDANEIKSQLDEEHSLVTEDSTDVKPSKRKTKRRPRNFRKRKRAITDNSSPDGPFKRTRRGVLEKKNVFERRTRSSKK
ncbi:similar to Saccharomyces cerevisiae YMR219W ESC1 Protein localized to the nuclear periphery, involved in telomeric silencing [Maudiozyma saulgeensis]|uniref:Similar to Saccharomyces cerevisiae YMR219W ESC1 Protein localized to the nuclear periphery, involved in telomeric silencing n=1 Tax=Maudiozyma saulgeensis TaxID=1789683 RepID=A0A1X7R8T2_9SACH|nr:similar to Saccharomyces cerevisiae YMR219W ESC1 Protein localized to the nuclear periphery, involved in telomeric silencing [Kazachstania saulgeensis]